MRTFKLLTFMAVFLSVSVRAQTEQATPATCTSFVQAFYDWYVPKALEIGPHSFEIEDAVKMKPKSFTSELARALITDREAQKKAHELVGLDFDPFLNSQDPSPKFKVQSVTVQANRCTADVYGWQESQRGERVMPKLIFGHGYWQFADFFYPAQDNIPAFSLLNLLKGLRDDRAKDAGSK